MLKIKHFENNCNVLSYGLKGSESNSKLVVQHADRQVQQQLDNIVNGHYDQCKGTCSILHIEFTNFFI